MALRPFRRRILVVGLLLLGVVAAGVLALLFMLDSDVVRRGAETRLSMMLGQPVSIGSLHVSLFPTPALAGAEIRVGDERQAPDVALERIRIVPRLGSLLRRAYVIREVTLEGLTVRVVRERHGRWKFPPVMPVPGGSEAGGIVIERVTLRGGRVRVGEFSDRDKQLHETSSIDDLEGEAVSEGSGLRNLADTRACGRRGDHRRGRARRAGRAPRLHDGRHQGRRSRRGPRTRRRRYAGVPPAHEAGHGLHIDAHRQAEAQPVGERVGARAGSHG